MKFIQFFFVIIVLPLFLSGCLFGSKGYIHNRKLDYVNAKTEPVLKQDKQAAIINQEPKYVIPTSAKMGNRLKPNLVPPTIQASLAEQQTTKSTVRASLVKQNNTVVLVLTGKAAKVWSQLNNALIQTDYQITGTSEKSGVIEFASLAQSNEQRYQLSINHQKESSIATLLNQQGQPLAVADAKAILSKIKGYLNGN